MTTRQTTTKPKGLHAKLAEVYKAIEDVAQSGYNDHLKYHYPTDSDLYKTVRPHLAEHGLLLTPSLVSLEGDGNAATVILRFRWIDVETGETMDDEWAGTGTDRGGTAVYKAYTGAIRTYLAKFFQIPTGENPEEGHGDEGNGAKQTTGRVTRAHEVQASEKLASPSQKGKINAKAGEAELSQADLANVLLSAAGEEPRDFGDPAVAENFTKRNLDRLPARLVTPILKAIESAKQDADVPF